MVIQDDNEFMNTQESSNKKIGLPMDGQSNQVNMRIRQRNDYQIKKGRLEQEEKRINRQKDQKKNKQRALERLRDLERIQKYNQLKFKKEIESMEHIQIKNG